MNRTASPIDGRKPGSPFSVRCLLAMVMAILLAEVAVAATYTVNPDRDAFIKEDKASENHDTDQEVQLFADNSNAKRIVPLYHFALPSIPSNEVITSATLRLWVRRDDTNTLTVNRVTDTWAENTVTWANTGGDWDSTATASFVATPNNSFVSIDVTGLVQAWAAGTYANNGVAILPSAGTDVKFTAREFGTASQRPELVITTAVVAPVLTVVKSNTLLSDPYNASTNPKAIPGAVLRYTINVSNSTVGIADNNSTIVTDAVPSNMRLYVGDYGAAGSGPISFTNGSPSSTLIYTYTSLSSTTDSISFSNNGGSTYTYTPVPDANGYDANVTHFRVNPSGSFAGVSGGSNPSFQLQLRMQVK